MLFLFTSQSTYCFFTFYESKNTTKQQRSILIYLGLRKFTVNPSRTKKSQGPTCKSLNHKEEARSKDSSPVLCFGKQTPSNVLTLLTLNIYKLFPNIYWGCTQCR
jgi:hypothetical protein